MSEIPSNGNYSEMESKLLVKFLANECTEKEKKEVLDWIESDPVNRQSLKSIERVWKVEPEHEFQADSDEAWSRFENNVLKDTTESIKRPSKNIRKSNKYFYAIAAASVLLISVFLFLNQIDSSQEVSEEQLAMQEIVTQKGEKTRIKLSDNTHVILNSDSKLKISNQFSEGTREVYLVGEAHFDVTPNNEKPFIVHSNQSYTKVLGTEFIISSYPDEKDVSVVVAEGKVLLGSKNSDSKNKGVISKGYSGVLRDESSPIITKVRNMKLHTGWTEDLLVFDNTSLRNIKPQIERWYNVSIKVKNSELYSRRLTAEFKDEPLDEVLNVISLSMDLKYSRDKRKVTFYN